MIDIRRMVKSFQNARRGVVLVFTTEQSFRVQVYVALVVCLFGALVQVRSTEWIVLLLLIASVLTLELVNSIFERLIDTFKPRIHPVVRDMKDMMAGAVLIASCLSVVIGLLILLPHLIELVGRTR